MVDTLVLGTSAKAWEFESLHAQIKGNDYRSFFYANFLFAHRPLTQDCCSVFATTGFYPFGYPASYGSCSSPTMQASLFMPK